MGFASGLFLAALEDPGERAFGRLLATDHFARLLAARFPAGGGYKPTGLVGAPRACVCAVCGRVQEHTRRGPGFVEL